MPAAWGGAVETSEFAIEDIPELNNCQGVGNSIPELRRDEKNTEDATKVGANQQAITREVEIQRELQKITSNTQKYMRYLELTAKQADIVITIPRRRW
jgi:hypothetical protein